MANSLAVHEKFLRNQSLEILSDFRTLDNIKIRAINNSQKSIEECIEKDVLVYRFSQFSCPPCVENDMEILNQITDSIGAENILVLSDVASLKEMKIFSEQNHLKFPLYSYPSQLSLQADNDTIYEASYYFVLDCELKTKFTYISRSDHAIESPYFKRIIEHFHKE
jgi:peroxiredoxin